VTNAFGKKERFESGCKRENNCGRSEKHELTAASKSIGEAFLCVKGEMANVEGTETGRGGQAAKTSSKQKGRAPSISIPERFCV
jgi:hypothetical protein